MEQYFVDYPGFCQVGILIAHCASPAPLLSDGHALPR